MRRRPWTLAVGVVAVRSARTASRGSERSTSTPSARRVRRRASPRLCCCRGMQSLAALLVKERYYRRLASMRRPSRTASVFVVIDAARLPRLLCVRASCFSSARCSATLRLYRFRLNVDQRTPHGPHRCALSLKRAAVSWRSVAHTTLGWHCCSPERRGPAGTQVTRAVEKWSQDGLPLLVGAAGQIWPPRAARRVVHAPRVRRPSLLKALEAAQG